MDCRRARSLFSERLDERLASDLAANHESHLRRCEPCRSEWSSYELFFASMPALRESEGMGPLVLPDEAPGQADSFRPQLLPSSTATDSDPAFEREVAAAPTGWRFLRGPQIKVAAAAAVLMGASHFGAFFLGKGEGAAVAPSQLPTVAAPTPLRPQSAPSAPTAQAAPKAGAGLSAVSNLAVSRSDAETRALVASHVRLLRWVLGSAEAASRDAVAARAWLGTSLRLLTAMEFNAAISAGLSNYRGQHAGLLSRYFDESDRVVNLLKCSLADEPGDACARMCLVRALQAGDIQLMDIVSELRPVLVGAGWSSFWQQDEGRAVLRALVYSNPSPDANDLLLFGLANLQSGDLQESLRVTGSFLLEGYGTPGQRAAAHYLYREASAEASMLCSSSDGLRGRRSCSESTLKRFRSWASHPARALEPTAPGPARSRGYRVPSGSYAVPVSGR